MADFRVEKHSILNIPARRSIKFRWKDEQLSGLTGETIASALFANGIHVFGHHHKDGSPQGIFCANGQCAQCMVLADGKPVKACMELLQPGMSLQPVEGLPKLPEVSSVPATTPIEELKVPVLIIGGGPAGLSAAIELGKLGIEALLLDDKQQLGGKLVLQTHRFFGSIEAVYAGTRGIDIAARLEKEVQQYPGIQIWLNSTALAVFSDHKVGILQDGKRYVLVTPQVLLVAAGAREKSLAFKGNTLPGVFGAGAFQTLVNRDLVRPAQRLFIVGGGNVGLIAGYHALQAGIDVVGLVEALPECGGYKVHKDKLARMGVPIYTSHTILSANGAEEVESVTVAQVDEHFQPITGTERSFDCDTILIAVGLDPIDEFYQKAGEFGLACFAAGDAGEIAEASAAMFSGRIRGREIARSMGVPSEDIPSDWYQMEALLKSKPGRSIEIESPDTTCGVTPILHCSQEIPCNPCSAICPKSLIKIDTRDLRQIPRFVHSTPGGPDCGGCERCVAICPGLAITLVDSRKNPDIPMVSIPFEFEIDLIQKGDMVTVLDTEGASLGDVAVYDLLAPKFAGRTKILRVQAPAEMAGKIAGVRMQNPAVTQALDRYVAHVEDDTVICRCERITAGEIRKLIRSGYYDLNEIKAVSRAGMGACGAKTCNSLIRRMFREEGVPPDRIIDESKRPLLIEVPLGIFAGESEEGGLDK
ncbi:MAG: FAD-dependent oxidoreductase [Anaerolineaceae bacterium]|nr:FAD-dependent oxidoreductase [Anaerolineaceae bacterium]